jgi:hypothetical protein
MQPHAGTQRSRLIVHVGYSSWAMHGQGKAHVAAMPPHMSLRRYVELVAGAVMVYGPPAHPRQHSHQRREHGLNSALVSCSCDMRKAPSLSR